MSIVQVRNWAKPGYFACRSFYPDKLRHSATMKAFRKRRRVLAVSHIHKKERHSGTYAPSRHFTFISGFEQALFFIVQIDVPHGKVKGEFLYLALWQQYIFLKIVDKPASKIQLQVRLDEIIVYKTVDRHVKTSPHTRL